MKRTTVMLVAALTATLSTGCANMNHRQRNTAIGATAGAIAGSILTDGDAVGTVGGAAVGGLIGYKTTPTRHHH